MIKKCLECWKEYKTRRDCSKFCCFDCRVKHQRLKDIPCLVCWKMFHPSKSTVKTCSKKWEETTSPMIIHISWEVCLIWPMTSFLIPLRLKTLEQNDQLPFRLDCCTAIIRDIPRLQRFHSFSWNSSSFGVRYTARACSL